MKFFKPAANPSGELESSPIITDAQQYVRNLVNQNHHREVAKQPSLLVEAYGSDDTTLAQIIDAVVAVDNGGVVLARDYAVSPADMALVCYLLRERPNQETFVADPILDAHIKQMFTRTRLDTIAEAVESRLESYERATGVLGSEVVPAQVADALRSELALYEHNALK